MAIPGKLEEMRRVANESWEELRRWHDTDPRYLSRLVQIRVYQEELERLLASQPPVIGGVMPTLPATSKSKKA